MSGAKMSRLMYIDVQIYLIVVICMLAMYGISVYLNMIFAYQLAFLTAFIITFILFLIYTLSPGGDRQ